MEDKAHIPVYCTESTLTCVSGRSMTGCRVERHVRCHCQRATPQLMQLLSGSALAPMSVKVRLELSEVKPVV